MNDSTDWKPGDRAVLVVTGREYTVRAVTYDTFGSRQRPRVEAILHLSGDSGNTSMRAAHFSHA
jgi:hypothetical protein